jgi:ACS family D-galactonate transporter-like MFS transporter
MAWPVRYKLVGLLTAGSTINYADRVNISVAAPAMMMALGWDEAHFGVIFSAFLIGYTLLQIPGGVLADRWNATKILAWSCVGFSVFTALTPLGALAFGLMLAIRVAVGMFESVSFPAYASLNSRWIPRAEFSRAQTWSLSGAYLGQALSYPITTWIVLTFSWPMAFYFNAFLGGVWLIAWLAFATNTPAEHPQITAAELHEIEADLVSRQTTPISPWVVLKEPQVLLLSFSYLCLVYGLWMIILWLPTYMVKARGFTMQEMGWIGMIPTFTSFAGLISGGVLSDALLRRGFSTRFARAQGPSLCIALGLPFLVAAVLVPWSSVSVACLAVYLFLSNIAGGGYWSMPLEFNPKLVGAIAGFMNCAGNFAGIFGPMTAGFIISGTGNWAFPFLVAAGFAFIAFVVLYFLVIPKPIEVTVPLPQAVAQEARV